ncbi:MAG: peptide-methionine (S)-S-oxide reductase MsrA [Pseudorhodobacter sp.]|nr:peptide-methionine (S)-S-oxide reductase MsrA [Pseudorhodobacter sp.]
MNRLAFGLLAALACGSAAQAETAVLAGGCFWCVESDFEAVPGVSEVVSGYTGGSAANPTYKQVGSGTTGHREAVEITFDASRISYAEILRLFLRSIDPLDAKGQFCDRGQSYQAAIFVSGTAQQAAAAAAIAEAAQALGRKVVTPILPAATFWPAEDYHQDYYKGRNIVLTRAGPKQQANAYRFYREACRRDARVRAVWGAAAAFANQH